MNPFGDQHNIGLMDYSYNNFQYHQNAPSPPLPLPLPPSSPLEKRRGGKRGTRVKLSTDPQSVAARQRRHRISDRFRILKSLVPGGSKMDTVSMLEEAIHYVKFLKTQIWLHQAALMLPMDDPCHASSYGHPSTACGYHGSGTSGSGSSFASSQMFAPPQPQPQPQEMVSYSMQPTPPHPLPPLPYYYHQDEEMLPNLA